MTTLDRVKEKVFNNSLKTCEYISGYENYQSLIKVKCLIHNYEFETKYDNVRRDNRPHHICPLCKQEDQNIRFQDSRIEVECAYCGKKFSLPKSKIENSKSGLYFCCREHKDLAQRLDSGKEFEKIRPNHYGLTGRDYRKIAFRNYPHKCNCCGWSEDERLLEVHHIDSNRDNNDLSNLVILCPICHRKITLKYYIYDKNKGILIKI